MLKFRQIPGAGRVLIVAVGVGVFAIALVACATSYNAIYRLVGQLGLYGQFTTQGFPLLLDAAFLVAESAAILGYIMRAVTRSDEVSYGWPVMTMLVCGLCTIGFNVAHAYLIGGRHDPLTVWRCLVAALPPVLMILSFQVLIVIVKWVMLRLGNPAVNGTVPGAALLGVQPGPSVDPRMQVPSVTRSRMGQSGQWGSEVGGGEVNKRAAIQTAAVELGTEEVTAIGPEGVAAYLAENHGVQTTPGYVRKVLDGRAGGASVNGKGHP